MRGTAFARSGRAAPSGVHYFENPTKPRGARALRGSRKTPVRDPLYFFSGLPMGFLVAVVRVVAWT